MAAWEIPWARPGRLPDRRRSGQAARALDTGPFGAASLEIAMDQARRWIELRFGEGDLV